MSKDVRYSRFKLERPYYGPLENLDGHLRVNLRLFRGHDWSESTSEQVLYSFIKTNFIINMHRSSRTVRGKKIEIIFLETV